jgi:hypothetical protein
VSPLGIPSETKNAVKCAVKVVPIFAPKMHAIAAGSGTVPLATSATIAVVLRLLDCHSIVMTIPPRNMYIGLDVNQARWSMLPKSLAPPLKSFRPT